MCNASADYIKKKKKNEIVVHKINVEGNKIKLLCTKFKFNDYKTITIFHTILKKCESSSKKINKCMYASRHELFNSVVCRG